MLEVNVSIVRFVEEHQPNIIEARLRDALDRERVFVDKCVIFTADDLDENSPYPQPGAIACEVVKREYDAQGREVVTVDTETPWHVEDISGGTRFMVFAHQLNDTDSTGGIHAL